MYGEMGGGMREAWAEVLDISPADVPFRLSQVAKLFDEVRDAADGSGRAAYAGIPAHLNTLSTTVFPNDSGLNGKSVPPNAVALEALGMFSAYLEDVRPDGRIPEDEDLEALREQVQQLLTDAAAADLPPEVKRALLSRLGDIVSALDDLNIGGPDAAARAAEALATVATLAEDAGADPTLTTRMRKTAKAVWIAVQVTSAVTTLGLNWDKIVDGEKALPPAQVRLQIEAGPHAAANSEDAPPPSEPDDDEKPAARATEATEPPP